MSPKMLHYCPLVSSFMFLRHPLKSIHIHVCGGSSLKIARVNFILTQGYLSIGAQVRELGWKIVIFSTEFVPTVVST